MKRMKKMLALVTTLAMLLTMVAATGLTAFAADGTIKITPPTGVDAAATNTYKIYKVFDAVGDGSSISYKLVSGKTTAPAGFEVDSAGNVVYTANKGKQPGDEGFVSQLSAADIAAIAAYVTEDDLVDIATSTGTAVAESKSLPNGFYYIKTSTGTAVTIDSTNPNAEVIDKNTVPSVDKKITGATSIDENGKKALAQVGTVVEYSGTITVGTGAENYIFHDTMETGLTYNGDVAVKDASGNVVAATNYEVDKTGDKTADDTFSVSFSNDYIKTLAAGTTLTVTYSATVNDDAITLDPLNNTAYVSYGDKNSNHKTPVSEADVYEAKISVLKLDGDEEPLAGAGFVLQNAAGKYYKLANNAVTWVDSIGDADEHVSDADGAVAAFTGLANGTYKLVEKTVPAGYNKAADKEITIAEHDYTAANLEQEATVINESGTELPSTGGIGTTIFYILGTLLVVGCGIVLVSRKRMEKNN